MLCPSNVGLRAVKFFRNVRTTLYVLVFVCAITAIGALLWINHVGLPATWRTSLEHELSKQGIEAAIGKLRYIPLRGIEASSVEIYSTEKREHRLAHFERLVFDLDKTKALRGIIRLTHIELQNADLSLPVDPNDESAGTLDVTDLNGKILMSKGRKIEVTQAKGAIGGINLTVDAVILGYRPRPGYQGSEDSDGKHRRFMKQFVQELDHWQLDADSPPELDIKLEADATKWSNLKANFTFRCDSAQRERISLHNITAEGNVVNALISIHHFTAFDQRGKLLATIDYDLNSRSGNFDAQSSIDALNIVYAVTGQRLLSDFSLAEAPKVHALGQFAFPADRPIEIATQGHLACKNIMFRGSPLDAMEMEFSQKGKDLFLRNAKVSHASGVLEGRLLLKDQLLRVEAQGSVPMPVLRPFYRDHRLAPALEFLEKSGLTSLNAKVQTTLRKTETGFAMDKLQIQEIDLQHKRGSLSGWMELANKQVRYQLESNLPPEIGKPFFPGQPLEKVLGDFTVNAASKTYVKLDGTLDTTNKQNWSVKGIGKVENLSYRGVPVVSVQTSMDLKHGSLLFSDIAVDFDYRNYELQRSFQGGTHGLVQAKSVSYKHEPGLVEITGLRGSIHPVPLLEMFAKPVAESLKQFRFRSPPTLSANGVIDVRNRGLTRLQVNLAEAKALDWEFLGKPVTFRNASTQLLIRAQDVTLSKLSCVAFDGDCNGEVAVAIKGAKTFSADIRWSNIAMSELAETYEFKEKGYGKLTGRIELAGVSGDTSTLQGHGLCSLEKGELFAVPIFGPLSPVIAGVLGDRRAGFERAKDAFCNFKITKGVIHTNDFMTQTSSLKFTGNGDVDLNKKTIDMTIRMNARGLLGIITLPLQPIIKGLFQFQGQGPLNKPKWEHVVFTSPPEEEQETLLRNAPRRATVVPED